MLNTLLKILTLGLFDQDKVEELAPVPAPKAVKKRVAAKVKAAKAKKEPVVKDKAPTKPKAPAEPKAKASTKTNK